MASMSFLWLFIAVLTVFTIILGAALLFYQSQDALRVEIASADPAAALFAQGAVIAIMFMFIGGAVLFLLGAVRYLKS